jgi:hypothetical protein
MTRKIALTALTTLGFPACRATGRATRAAGHRPWTSPSVAAGTRVTAMPADVAGHGPVTRHPPARPGAGIPPRRAAAAHAGDITRTGGTGQLAARLARSSAPDCGPENSTSGSRDRPPLALPGMGGRGLPDADAGVRGPDR